MKLEQPTWARPWPAAVVRGWATLGPVGRLPAPGTWGSACSLVCCAAWFRGGYPGNAALIVFGLVAGYLAVGICGEAERTIGRTDPGEIVLDEFVALPLCFLGWPMLVHPPAAWCALVLGFILFRIFDIAKPWGIRRLQGLPGGWGVVLDDTAAALASCIALHLILWVWRAL